MPDSEGPYKRINVMVRQDQYDSVSEAGLNMSGLIRGLLDDHLSHSRIVFAVDTDVRAAYDSVRSNLGAEDKDLEPYFLEALDRYLEEKTREIKEIRRSLKRRRG